jgi:hypothetical protein
MEEVMKPIVLCGVSFLLCLTMISCEDSSAEQGATQSATKSQDEVAVGIEDTLVGKRLLDTTMTTLPAKDTGKVLPPRLVKTEAQEKKGSTHLPKEPKEPRRFYVMYQRTFDSLMSTEGAVARLHPEDRALYDRKSRSGKLRLPKLDPVTHRPLPFPYSYPDVYGADIRRLDSIKAAEAQKSHPPQGKDSIPKPQR